jgi:hypothetical protein
MTEQNKKASATEVGHTGNGTARDPGRGAPTGHGTHRENGVRSADPETPGVKTRDADPDEPESDVNRDE